MPDRQTCPACRGAGLELVAHMGDQPTVGTVLYASAEEALAAPTAAVDVGYCRRCGLLRNLGFDPELVEYDASYENSQHFSPRFEAYISELTEHLVATYGLKGGAVAEVGSGKGEFLARLCAAGASRAIGYDPSYAGELDGHPLAGRIDHVRRYFDLSEPLPAVDLVCCRHVLEHFEEPGALLATFNRSQSGPATPVYVEVPNGEFVLSDTGMWDFIYQHVSYFTAASLEALFDRCGFELLDLRTAFDGQFLAVEAVPVRPAREQGAPSRDVDDVRRRVEALRTAYRVAVDRWEHVFGPGEDIVLWGAGAKGVTFLNTTKAGSGVRAVVDVNPRKQGNFVAGTGQPIIAPEELVDDPPDRVLVMNPAYAEEIRVSLADLHLSPKVECV